MTHRHILTLLSLAVSAAALAQEPAAVFDFADPSSLNPSLPVPEKKEWIELNSETFTNGPISLTFHASETGNTHVRLFHSYDAGCDLRLYDGDDMVVTCTDGSRTLDRIVFTGSLSGMASGSSDIVLVPSQGTFVWEEVTWLAGNASLTEVTLVSDRQSRMTRIEVYMTGEAGVPNSDIDMEAPCEYYTITGRRLDSRPVNPGIYLVRQNASTRKIIITK